MNKLTEKTLDIVVVGSSNTDMVIKAPHVPKAGETILGGKFFMNQGGKGANQAVAAARLGGNVGFIGRVGKDIFGDQAISNFQKQGISIDFTKQDVEAPTGVATITVDDLGQNSIVVAPGANAKVSKEDIQTARHTIECSKVLLLQLEINLETVLYVARYGSELGKKVILNPAPYAELPEEVYPYLYAITPNQTEAQALTGIQVIDKNSAEKAATFLREKGVESVIITMGETGAFVMSTEFTGLLRAEKTVAVDTTAAGDTFNGALAVALAKGSSIQEAVIFANKAAAFSVTKLGAQPSCPTLEDLAFTDPEKETLK